jgi:hypothetical protein
MAKHIQDLIASRRAVLGGLATMPLLGLSQAKASAPATSRALRFSDVTQTRADSVAVPPGYRAQTLISWGDALYENVAPFNADRVMRADQELRFGQNNDMLALFPAQYSFPFATDQNRFLLCANHEYVTPALHYPGAARINDLTSAHWEAMYAAIGVTVVETAREGQTWRTLKDSAPGAGRNRRITPFTPVQFTGPAARHRWIQTAGAVVNAKEAAHGAQPENAIRCGTMANCAGGRTPWGTYLTSEENFNNYFLISDENAAAMNEARADQAWIFDAGKFGYPLYAKVSGSPKQAPAQFDVSQNPYGPALYGWVVEIDPYDPAAAPKKRTALGRKKGECATTAIAKDGRVAVYMGDDQIDEFVYKFVTRGRFNAADRAANRDLLDEGTLYAAKFNENGSGEWLKLDLASVNRAVREAPYHAPFADEADLYMRTREAARLLGATPMDRPEDVEAPVDANWCGQGTVLVACTYNRTPEFYRPANPRRGAAQNQHVQQGNFGGHIIRIDERGGDHAATRFSWDVFTLCGDPEATASSTLLSGEEADLSVSVNGKPTMSGARFSCPDNLCFDSAGNVWIATDGSDAVFADCNDAIMAAPINADGPRAVKRFLVGPVGCEICGPTLALDETALLCAIQHPGEHDVEDTSVDDLRWKQGKRPPSTFPDGGAAWPRSAVIVITRENGGLIGD